MTRIQHGNRSGNQEARKLASSGRLKVRWNDWLERPPPALIAVDRLSDKVEGMLLGLAVGDALGNTSESMNPSDRLARFGWIDGYLPNRHAGGRRLGLPSDDTQLAFRTLLHLVEHGHLAPQRLAATLSEGRIYGIGKATSEWLARFKSGLAWHEAGVPSAGNGALMRIAPVLLPYLREPSCDLWTDALIASHLTHDDELSNTSCVAMVDALWRALGAETPVAEGWWLERWVDVTEPLETGLRYRPRNGHPQGFEGTLSQLLKSHVVPALKRQLSVDAAGSIWHSGAYLLETVPTVLYILECYGNDPREAILQAVNQTRDNDTAAAIVGAAVGALHGASRLPQDWIAILSGRMADDDDHHIFDLLAKAGQVFEFKSSGLVTSRAALYAENPRDDAAVDPPRDLKVTELWFKVVDFLQQNWAAVREEPSAQGVRIWFFDDGLRMFDFIDVATRDDATRSLQRNGFERHSDDESVGLSSPVPYTDLKTVTWVPRRIYSSGRYWIHG